MGYECVNGYGAHVVTKTRSLSCMRLTTQPMTSELTRAALEDREVDSDDEDDDALSVSSASSTTSNGSSSSSSSKKKKKKVGLLISVYLDGPDLITELRAEKEEGDRGV